MKRIISILTTFSLISGCGFYKNDESEERTSENIITKKLEIPWQMNTSKEKIWISERTGKLVLVGQNHKKTSYTPEFSSTLSDEGEGGFLGFLLDPQFNQNQKAFAYYTYKKGSTLSNRIVEMHFSNGKWNEARILLDHIPGGFIHNGGRLEWGPDEKLYLTTGDSGDEIAAQKLDSLAGKILRINPDGTIPKKNPFYPSPIFTFGHRNPQGLAWDEEGTMYAVEHGSSHEDEINIIESGENYGWPIITGSETEKNMRTPWIHSGKDTWAPSGIQYYKGSIYFAALRGEGVYKVAVTTRKVSRILNNEGRIRDILIKNNELYAITNNTDGRGHPSEDDDRLLQLSLR